MTEPLNRDEVIALLRRLGGESDEEVLAVARDVHGRVSAAGADWEDLLVPEPGEEAPDEQIDEFDELDEPDELEDQADQADDADDVEEADAPLDKATGDADAMRLIEELLARKGNSEAFVEELEGYKNDIAEGEFHASDLRYLRAVRKRLGGR